jgi:hypothetical protein
VNKKQASPSNFGTVVVERIHYISVPPAVADAAVQQLLPALVEWERLPVDTHVLDFKLTTTLSDGFLNALRGFAEKLRSKNMQLISLNMTENLFRRVKSAGADGFINRVKNQNGTEGEGRQLSDIEKRRLLFKYLAEGAYKAVEVALGSTVSCDENYSIKPESLPLDKFDLVSVLTIRSDFMKADFRLCSTLPVIEKLTRAMLGGEATIDTDLIEGTPTELLNMIYGFAKSNLNDKENFRLPMGIPTLLRKSDFSQIRRSPTSQITIMPMVTPMGPFYIEVDFGVQGAPRT